jgi:ABC-2 type transport system ATP-binding protein
LSDSSASAIEFDGVSKWYGDTVAVAEVTFAPRPGVTGLLGHNGAGKSTALKLLAGFARPSAGTVRVLGNDPANDRALHRRLGVVTDSDAIWPFLTPRRFVSLMAELHGVADAGAAASRAIEMVDLSDVAERQVGGFSKGMRQRTKLAAALAHDPEVLLLDEPLNGLDPAQRAHTVELIRRLGAEGRSVLVSSHVLHEVERMAESVLVLVNGRLVAEGQTSAIRNLLADRPRTMRIESERASAIAQGLIAAGVVESVRIDGQSIVVETHDVDGLARQLAPLARAAETTLDRVEPLDDDLESVYAYLQTRSRGG